MSELIIIDCFELKKKIDSNNPPVLVDVRLAWERSECKLENDVHIPIAKLEANCEKLDRDAEIVVYCQYGIRSGQGAVLLAEKGFLHVCHLKGGLHKWAELIDPTMTTY